ncbi:brassinosteroid-responsive RING protein 1-like [Syzygium oleosum]|uniref:brassinosteroid-responsive RING protein 1-like n=1 Tax=Syzygium oleosum TaxID=219896 RepID=UPI0024BBB6EA|nr:brassinosteroid-responsive RING protein 1-like [Syzygium oleosum]
MQRSFQLHVAKTPSPVPTGALYIQLTISISLSLRKFMGFPVNYTDFLLPRLLVHSIKAFISFLLHFSGLLGLLGPGIASFPGPPASVPESGSVATPFIRELLLPTARFSDLAGSPESCAVCLEEFEGDDEIRQLENCRHVYHWGCLNHWMAYDQCTCPLGRKPLVPDYVDDTMNEVLWAATQISQFYAFDPEFRETL